MTAPLPQSMRSLVDRLTFALVTYGWKADDVASYSDRLRQYRKAVSADYDSAFEQVDAKTTGLLTHVSLMIAGLGLIAPLVVDSHVELGIVIAEIAVYLLIAVGCLRCLSVFHTREFVRHEEHMEELAIHELIIRRELYSLCVRFAILITIAVFLLLPVLYFWTPGTKSP
jgi:hypothetical protein